MPPTPNLLLEQVTREGISLIPQLQHEVLLIRFSGNGDLDAVPALNAYLKEVQKEALRLTVREVKCDFTELYFLNSSCLRAFVSWIAPLSRMLLPPYRIVIVSNPQRHWQNRSLDSLRQLAPALVTVEKPNQSP